MEETGLCRVECQVIMDVVTTVLLLRRPATLQDLVQWRVFVNSVMESLFT